MLLLNIENVFINKKKKTKSNMNVENISVVVVFCLKREINRYLYIYKDTTDMRYTEKYMYFLKIRANLYLTYCTSTYDYVCMTTAQTPIGLYENVSLTARPPRPVCNP